MLKQVRQSRTGALKLTQVFSFKMYFLKRILGLIPLLLVISFLAFCLVRVAPGGPFDMERAPASPIIEEKLKEKYHLDEPIWQQYLRFLAGAVQGDLSPSMKYRNHSVTDIIVQGAPITLSLGCCSFLFALGVGIPMGFLGAVYKGRWLDHLTGMIALTLVCVPSFVIGPILIMIFSVKLGWTPVGLWESPISLILPVMTLGLFFSGKVARLVREGMMDALNAEFIRTAKAKGLSETTAALKHGLRVAILPVVSFSGPMLADLLTGSFVVENLFQIPGIGVFMVNSSLNRDFPMVVGLALLYATILVFLNLCVDFLYTRLDPRVKFQRQ